MLAATRATQRFQSISRRNRQLPQFPNAVELRQLPRHGWPQRRRARTARAPAVESVKKVFRSGVGERAYHSIYYNGYRNTVPACVVMRTPCFCCGATGGRRALATIVWPPPSGATVVSVLARAREVRLRDERAASRRRQAQPPSVRRRRHRYLRRPTRRRQRGRIRRRAPARCFPTTQRIGRKSLEGSSFRGKGRLSHANAELCSSASNKMRPDGRRAPARRPPAAHRLALPATTFRYTTRLRRGGVAAATCSTYWRRTALMCD